MIPLPGQDTDPLLSGRLGDRRTVPFVQAQASTVRRQLKQGRRPRPPSSGMENWRRGDFRMFFWTMMMILLMATSSVSSAFALLGTRMPSRSLMGGGVAGTRLGRCCDRNAPSHRRHGCRHITTTTTSRSYHSSSDITSQGRRHRRHHHHRPTHPVYQRQKGNEWIGVYRVAGKKLVDDEEEKGDDEVTGGTKDVYCDHDDDDDDTGDDEDDKSAWTVRQALASSILIEDGWEILNAGEEGVVIRDLSWRVEKLRLEEQNTKRFLKARPRFLPYDECRKWVQAWSRWKSKEDWREWIHMGEKRNPYIPSEPDKYYGRSGEWISWDHFLGIDKGNNN